MKETKRRLIVLIIITMIVFFVLCMHKNKPIAKDDSSKNSLAIMVYDESKKDYVKQATFPKGRYELSSDSYCENGTPIGTYDSENGTIATSFTKSDQCYYYFNLKKATPTLTLKDNIVENWGGVSSGGSGWTVNTYTYDGDGTITCNMPGCIVDSENKTIKMTSCNTGTVTITASETERYESVSVTFSLIECLHPDTLVDYYDKKKRKRLKKKIKDIEAGDEIYTYNYENNKTELKRVKKVTTCKVKEAVVLTINGEEITVAKGHPICVDGIGLLDVSLIKKGYKLIRSDGTTHIVENVKIINYSKEQIMYNLELEDAGNFIIGKTGILCLSLVMISFIKTKDVTAAVYNCWVC